LFEAGGIPASSKAIALLLPAEERALGSALSQVGLTLGSSAAPKLAAFMEPRYGWQAAFVTAGLLGFVWIPVWLLLARTVRPAEGSAGVMPSFGSIFRDRRMWVLIAGNLLVMTGYSLWTQWATLFFVDQYGWTQLDANQRLVWIPPIFATLGGFAGGFWAYWRIRRGGKAIMSRLRICGWAVVPLALTAGTVWMPTAEWATAGICACLFFTVTLSVNLYALPLDLFPPDRAAFAVSLLTAAYGLTNTVWSKVTGWLVSSASFEPVVVASSLVPLLGVVVLWSGLRDEAKA
jgi:ACS family hexuronate transporter-like MFS transporter